MSRSAPTLLARLRRHRGLWVLAMAVLMIKLVAGTLCLADAPDGRFAAGTASAATTPQLAEEMATPTSNADGDTCLLGEPGGCHCTCAHSVTLPTAAVMTVSALPPHFDVPALPSSFTPAMTGSLLRPPIA
jgi:hypothetical protein